MVLAIMDDVCIRKFRPNDTLETAQIFFDAVRIGTVDHYSQTQREAWAPNVPETTMWLEKLLSQTTFVAEHGGKPIGFMTLMPSGHIDLAFVAPDVMGQGIAKKLYEAILSEAQKLEITRLSTDASFPARSFFEHLGWSVVKEQSASCNTVQLTNFRMEKTL